MCLTTDLDRLNIRVSSAHQKIVDGEFGFFLEDETGNDSDRYNAQFALTDGTGVLSTVFGNSGEDETFTFNESLFDLLNAQNCEENGYNAYLLPLLASDTYDENFRLNSLFADGNPHQLSDTVTITIEPNL